MAAALLALLAWFFTPPPPPPLQIPLPGRLVPGVKQALGEAVQGAYLLGVADGAALWIPVGAGGALVLLALLRSLGALAALLRSGARVLDALLPLLRPRSSDPPP